MHTRDKQQWRQATAVLAAATGAAAAAAGGSEYAATGTRPTGRATQTQSFGRGPSARTAAVWRRLEHLAPLPVLRLSFVPAVSALLRRVPVTHGSRRRALSPGSKEREAQEQEARRGRWVLVLHN